MDTGTGDKVREYWTDRSVGFDVATRKSLESPDPRIEDAMDRLGARSGGRVIDMGTGCGYLAVLFAERGFRVTGVDLSESMIGYARRIADERNLSVDFIVGDS
ncbi:MAG: methyltransferase domain-containing protein [Candidatus Methanomethylophilaceae archaeon]|nr:methyltransferase domain-containing protein [Candidatus Methanomethylophilaceae archaeon]